ncbi:PIN domain-containing protein [Mycena galopus ATCC 62051]|nr:PIN domain-containing protein [Mycena galopus ATCC 62051]
MATFSPISPAAYLNAGYFHAAPFSNGDTLAHLDNATLQQIDQLVQDVEMQAPVDERTICLVVDTNVLLEKQKLLERFVRDVEKRALPILVIIPGVVLHELDLQKKSDRLGWFARQASTYILEKVKEKSKTIRMQREQETCNPSGSWKIRPPGSFQGRNNDGLILDCCMYFRTKFPTRLCSGDKNLCTESETAEIPSISPRSGRELVRFLLGQNDDSFAAAEPDYTGPESLEHEQDDSMMDVDEELPKLTTEQAMDYLHAQIVDHFTRRLVELVGRVGPELEDVASDGGVTASQHAPKWKNGDTYYRQWNAAQCLEYLDQKRRMKKMLNPRLDVFLTKKTPDTRNGGNGARRGWEWSYEAWSNALNVGLLSIGENWNDQSILADLAELEQHRKVVFKLR